MSRNNKLVQALDTWRDTYNPLRGLTMPRAVALLESVNEGILADVMWAFDHIEGTDPDLLALVERRVTAIEEMDYDIKLASEEKKGKRWDKALAEAQQAALAAAYESIDNINEAIAHLAMATFRRYAIAQIHVDGSGAPRHIECIPQWNFARRGPRGDWYWNPDAQALHWKQLGDPLDIRRDRLIIREVQRYVDRYGLIKYVRATLSEKDWDGFVELFGFNQVIAILPPDVPEDKLDDYLATAAAVSQGGEGALPNGADVKFPNETRGEQPFRPRLEWLQQQLVLAGTGGLLTMLAAPGSGTLAGNAHAETFQTLARAEAKRISEVFQRSLDAMILDAQFPNRPRLAYFQIAANEEQDIGEVVDHAVKISTAFPGRSMDPDEFSEKTGYKLFEHGMQPLGNAYARLQARDVTDPPVDPAVPSARQRDEAAGTDLVAAGLDAALEADRADNRPLAERLYAILDLADDPELMRAALMQLKRDLPALAGQMLETPALADAIENLIAPAIVNGIATGVAEHAQQEPAT